MACLTKLYFQAMKVVNTQQTKAIQEKQKKEKELSKVKISKADVDLIVSINISFIHLSFCTIKK